MLKKRTRLFCPLLALLFGALLLASGTSVARRKRITKEVVRTVDVVAFSQGPQGIKGLLSKAKIMVRPNRSKEVRVAVYEEYSGGAGSQWRASVWIAAFLSTLDQGFQLTDFEFAVSTGGLIDGPSAGALMTSAMMAALSGARVDKNVTMTGTVNPDGSIGPVGGISHKLRAAAKAGKKKFGHPVGQRYDLDLETKRLVDLKALGKTLGVKVVELRDIHAAYRLLTGKSTKARRAVSRAEMVLDARTFDRMQARTSVWLGKTRNDIARIKRSKTSPAYAIVAQSMGADLAATYARANHYQTQGLVPIAYSKSLEAAATTAAMRDLAKLLQLGIAGDVDAVVLEVKALSSVESDLAAFQAQLDRREIRNVPAAMNLLDGYYAAAHAAAAIRMARAYTRQMAADLKANRRALHDDKQKMLLFVLGRGAYPVLYYRLAALILSVGHDMVDDRPEMGKRVTFNAKKLDQLARAYTSAAKANLDYYDALVLQQAADRLGTSMAAVKAAKFSNDVEYQFATQFINFALSTREDKGKHASLARLAAASTAYVSTAELVAKEYSLGVIKKDGKVVGVRQSKAFISMLELAERKAREAAKLALVATGQIPRSARTEYQRARVLREEEMDTKITALGAFWTSTITSQIAVQLQRTTKAR